jgi:hypothetical protein
MSDPASPNGRSAWRLDTGLHASLLGFHEKLEQWMSETRLSRQPIGKHFTYDFLDRR